MLALPNLRAPTFVLNRTFAVLHGGNGFLEGPGRPAEPLAHARQRQRPARHHVEAPLPGGAADAGVADRPEDDVAVEVEGLVELDTHLSGSNMGHKT